MNILLKTLALCFWNIYIIGSEAGKSRRTQHYQRTKKMKPMTERDEKGRTTHERRSDGTERWYDADGKTTHERLSNGDERWYDAEL